MENICLFSTPNLQKWKLVFLPISIFAPKFCFANCPTKCCIAWILSSWWTTQRKETGRNSWFLTMSENHWFLFAWRRRRPSGIFLRCISMQKAQKTWLLHLAPPSIGREYKNFYTQEKDWKLNIVIFILFFIHHQKLLSLNNCELLFEARVDFPSM